MNLPLRNFLSLTPSLTPGHAARSYVPLVFVSRGLAFFRVLLIARILGDAGQREFGLYQPALEFINFLVPLALLGLADLAERYTPQFEKQGQLKPWLNRQLARLLATAGIMIAILLIASPWLAAAIFKLPGPDHTRTYGILLIAASAANILLLVFYQFLAATLRGLRAYAPSAAMEFSSALLLFIFSAAAACQGTAIALLAAYALSLLIPLIYFAPLLAVHLKTAMSPVTPSSPQLVTPSSHTHFAAWALIRLLLVMAFGFLSVWGITFLASQDPHAQTGAFTMPYRIAQLLAYVAVTLWASNYALCARHWSHHQIRRAKAQLFRTGRFGAVILTLLALILLLTRGIFAALLPSAYAPSIITLLPPMLALFTWYGLLAFAGTYCDLQEKPHKSAILWAAAVAIQLIVILIPQRLLQLDPAQQVLLASCLGLATALLILAPLLLWRPLRFTATAVPLALLALAPLAYFSPVWVVDYLAPPILLILLAFLQFAHLIIRPPDRRAFRRWRARNLVQNSWTYPARM